MQRILALFLFMVLLLHGSVGLERALYVNELLSMLGALALVFLLYTRASSSVKGNGVIGVGELPVLLILFLGFVHIFVGFSINQDAGYYQKLRTLPIWYSALCFYIGNGFVYGILYRRSSGAGVGYLKYLAFPLSLASGGLISTASTISLSVVREKSRAFFFLAIIMFLVIRIAIEKFWHVGEDSSTLIILLVTAVVMYKFKGATCAVLGSDKLFMVALLFFFIAVVLLKLIALKFSVFFIYGFSLLDESWDMNAIWRLMFWAKTINDMSVTQLFTGIGLGTPIFDEYDPAASFIVASSPTEADRPYTLGLHNSFLTFFVRLGVPGIILLLYVVTKCINTLARMECQGSERLLVTLILILIPALFNVVLESPLYSGFFWAILGLCFGYAGNSSQRVRAH